MDQLEARAQFLMVLLDKVREDKYPSTTHMDIIEQSIPPNWIGEYLQILLAKIAEDTYPSIPMLNRIANLLDQMPREASASS
jgi:hypothetical protein